MEYIPNAIKFVTQSMLIINAVFEIVDLDLKLKTWAYVVSELQWVRLL